MHYNEHLADSQGISQEDRVLLDETYEKLYHAFENPSEYSSVEDEVTALEYKLQELWKFPQDPKFHRYQQNIKGCKCPHMDNMDLVGYDASRYRVSTCPWHWTEEDKS